MMSKLTVPFLIFLLINTFGCSKETSTQPSNGGENDTLFTRTTCEDGAEILRGGFLLSNNTWGKGDLTNYEQCITLTEVKTGLHFAWEWNWPNTGSNSVKAYPEIIYGWKPWSGSSTSSDLPLLLSDMDSVIVSLDIEESLLYGTGNLAFDLWITETGQPNGGNIRHEIMIWLQQQNLKPGGTKRGSVLIGGHTYDFYRADWSWTYLAFVLSPRSEIETVPVHEFLQYLMAEGHISSDEYLASIEFGNEIVYGSGNTVIQDFTIEVY